MGPIMVKLVTIGARQPDSEIPGARFDEGPYRGHALAPMSARFWKLVKRGGPDECWEWVGFRHKKSGYGSWSPRHDERWGAHRVAWVLANGRLPDGMVCHHCDNKPCCNPAHLYDGTAKTNAQDAKERGRLGGRSRGELNPAAKLTAAHVVQMRAAHAAGVGSRVLARQYGIGRSTTKRILRGLKWKHVEAVA